MSVNYVALGKRIGYFRMQCGNITQEALASKINRSREFLAKIEKGTEHPRMSSHCYKLFDLFSSIFPIKPLFGNRGRYIVVTKSAGRM